MSDLSLVEDSWYDHDEYGRIRLVRIDEPENEVLLEKGNGETMHVSAVGDIPAGTRESIDSFRRAAQPADISVTPPTVEINAESTDIR